MSPAALVADWSLAFAMNKWRSRQTSANYFQWCQSIRILEEGSVTKGPFLAGSNRDSAQVAELKQFRSPPHSGH